MNLNEIKQLPDIMSKEQLESYIIQYLDSIENLEKMNVFETLECFSEFADRKTYTYELLSDSLRKRLDSFVQKLWDDTSSELVDIYSSVVVNLNLKSSYNLMKESLNKDLDEDVREIIEETVNEIGEDIEVPFKMN
ncbi:MULTISPECIES: hypothetical protein [Paenibacillus]|uniref:hypothetical protein n=1 Tax=Paenibacillus TaxID=44249 RepID=UPI0004DB1BF7|nr:MULTISPECIES: hypothetical protein [Paenibacillus]KAF6558131.1 hypothetical protein G9G63_26170 [Paenibacillus sp. EKM202P]KAF6563217.1 hypothetical protein G9G64_26055 [Paenibacillus sp. EKM207P]KEO77634.1 hypothetical protein EL23_16195 [Paenibacillus polymyxa]MCH6189190.1 hypothetical protein [Paenibacillus polymyxa]WRL58376.1 hypothetical protein U3G77_09055 [Paenibacillus polymyxa]